MLLAIATLVFSSVVLSHEMPVSPTVSMKIEHLTPPPPGAKVWISGEPKFSSTHEKLSIGPSGASVPGVDGKPEGSGTWRGIRTQFYEGETVRVTLTASNFIVSFSAIDCAEGKPINRGVRDPWTPPNKSQSFEFKFQPEAGTTQAVMRISVRPSEYTAYFNTSGVVSWTFEPTDQEAASDAGGFTAADALDVAGAPALMYGRQTPVANATPFLLQGEPLKGVAADGASLVVLRAPTEKAGTAHFTVAGAGGALYPLVGPAPIKSVGAKSLDVEVLPVQNGKFAAVALYRPPSYFGHGSQAKKINLSMSFKPEGGMAFGEPTKLQLDLVRPPLVLVHGTYDNPKACYKDHDPDNDDAPLNMGPQFENLGFRVFYLDWEQWNGNKNPSSFQTNQLRVRDGAGGIKEALAEMRKEHIAVTQADVVCHSQGGVITRTYIRGYPFKVVLPMTHKHYTDPNECHMDSTSCWYHRKDNFYMGDVHRLITISSTHRGSHVCNVFKIMEDYPDSGVADAVRKLAADSFRVFVDYLISGVTTDGFYNQVPDSMALQSIGPTPVPSHAIACVGTDEDMLTVRPDGITSIGSVPGVGNYWNKLFKIYMGTTDPVRLFIFQKMVDNAPNKEEMRGYLAEYQAKLAKWNAHRIPFDPLNLAGAVSALDIPVRKDFNDMIYAIRRIVFEGDQNDCTVSMTSSFGGLKARYTFLATRTLHGWAPRYRHVQKRVLEVLCDDGHLLDPDGFPGYTGLQSKASTFAVSVPVEELGKPFLLDTSKPAPTDKPPVGAEGGAKPDPAGPWGGSWDTRGTWGRQPVVLKQSGNRITGTFDSGASTIEGTIEGNVFKFRFTRGGSKGTGQVTLSSDRKTFVGSFIEDDDPDKVPISIDGKKLG